MKKKAGYLLLIISFFAYSGLYSQSPPMKVFFSNHFGGSDLEQFFGGAACKNGDYILAGLSFSVDHDLLQPVMYDSANILIVRCDPNGNKIWAKTFGGSGYDKARYCFEDSDHNIIVVGGTSSSDGDITFNQGDNDMIVLKLDPDGNIIWVKTYGGSDYESARFGRETTDGNYIITGYSSSDDYDIISGGRGRHDGWLIKIDKAGDLIWTNTYGGSEPDRIRCCVETPDGGFLFSGESSSDTLDCVGNHGNADLWLGRVDSNGNLLWSKEYGGSGTDRSYHISSTPDGNYLVAVQTNSNDFDVTDAKGNFDCWLLKVDGNGNIIWDKTLGGSGRDMIFNAFETSDGIFMGGSSSSDDYDLTGVGCNHGDSFWLSKLDSDQNIIWNYCFGGSKSDVCNEMIVVSDSAFVMMGDSRSDDGDVGANYGDYDYWIMKGGWEPNFLPPVLPESLTTIFNYNEQALLINSPDERIVNLEIIGMDGKVVVGQQPLKLIAGENKINLSEINNLSVGMYFSNLYDSGSVTTIKIAKVN